MTEFYQLSHGRQERISYFRPFERLRNCVLNDVSYNGVVKLRLQRPKKLLPEPEINSR